MNFLRKILDILFPPNDVEKTLIAMCEQGAIPHALPVPHTNIFAVTNYREPIIRASIRVLKTKYNSPVARCFAQLLHEHITGILQDKEPFKKYDRVVIVPIPVTKSRLRERGFNQVELIASELQKLRPEFYSVKKLLSKVRETKKQAISVSKTKRKENIKGCFLASSKSRGFIKNNAKEKSTLYVVLDDVVTTGATMNEAMLTLGRAKYKPVIGIAVAH